MRVGGWEEGRQWAWWEWWEEDKTHGIVHP